MQTTFWIVMVFVMKIPAAFLLWMVWRVIKDAPDQVVGDADGGSGARVKPGPRMRGPHPGGSRPAPRARRRGDAGHREDRVAKQRERLRQGR